MPDSLDVILVGAGHAFEEHYAKPLSSGALSFPLRILGVVDTEYWSERIANQQLFANAWKVQTLERIPSRDIRDDVVVMVLTPDHYPIIAFAANIGFRRFFVEKPLVSRDEEVARLEELISQNGLEVYAVEAFIPKTLPLRFARGQLAADLRHVFVSSSHDGKSDLVGTIEGAAVEILEGDDFCLPDLARRPWLEHDREIGGMLRDLGTHAFAPLLESGVIEANPTIHHVGLAKLADNRATLRVLVPGEVEMHVTALLSGVGDVPVNATFGKVPLHGGLWSLAVRGSRGMFYAGLRSGQPSVFVKNDGTVTTFSLSEHPTIVMLEEAKMFFDKKIAGDGHVSALFESLRIASRLRAMYT